MLMCLLLLLRIEKAFVSFVKAGLLYLGLGKLLTGLKLVLRLGSEIASY